MEVGGGGRGTGRKANDALASCFVVVTFCALRRELRAAFCAAALENETPGFRGHAGTKSMGACALDFAGLISAFHDCYLGINR